MIIKLKTREEITHNRDKRSSANSFLVQTEFKTNEPVKKI